MDNLVDAVEELIEYIEENYVCDEHSICCEGETNVSIDPSRSKEFKDLIERVKKCMMEEDEVNDLVKSVRKQLKGEK